MAAVLQFLFFLINTLLTALTWAVVLNAIASWLIAFNVVNPHNAFVRMVLETLYRIVEPLCRPVRRILPDLGGIDLSPMVVIVVIIGVQNYLLPAFAQFLFGLVV